MKPVPGRVKTLLWSIGELRYLVSLAEAHAGVDVIADDLDRTQEEVMKCADAIQIVLLPDRPVCPRCGHGGITTRDGWCARCSLEVKAARWKEEDEREAELKKEVDRADARERKRRERRREAYGGNPRKGKKKND